MRRFIARLSPLAAFAVCLPAHAIIRYADGDPTSHTAAPTGTFANAGWQYEGQFGDPANEGNAYVGTPIGPHAFITAALDAGVPLRDVQEAASHADPRTTMRYDRARGSLDRRATYIVAAYLAGAAR